MRCIIAGSQSITDYKVVCDAIKEARYEITEVVSGCAKNGVDQLGIRWAHEHGIPVDPHPAKWRRADGSYNKGAGVVRNGEMAKVADGAIVVWDGQSPGSKNMRDRMIRLKKPCFVYIYTEHLVKEEEPYYDGIGNS